MSNLKEGWEEVYLDDNVDLESFFDINETFRDAGICIKQIIFGWVKGSRQSRYTMTLRVQSEEKLSWDEWYFCDMNTITPFVKEIVRRAPRVFNINEDGILCHGDGRVCYLDIDKFTYQKEKV